MSGKVKPGRSVGNKFDAIETQQAIRCSQPQVAVSGLSDLACRIDRSILDSPDRVTILRDATIRIECVRWDAQDHDCPTDDETETKPSERLRNRSLSRKSPDGRGPRDSPERWAFEALYVWARNSF